MATPMTRNDKITVAQTALRTYADSTNYGKFLSNDEAKHIASIVVDALIAAESGTEI